LSIANSNCECNYCHNKLTAWDYRYHGKHYCRKCYEILFPLNICSICKKNRRIYYKLKIPICKSCQQKDVPCIRCGKIEYSNGKITEFGPVCKSCAKYFVEKKQCTECNEYNINICNRNLLDGTVKLLCQKCYSKTLPICSQCSYRKKAYCYSLDKKPICKICATYVTRECVICGYSFAAGKGTICPECNYKNSLTKKTNFIANALSKHMQNLFYTFSIWLTDRRGLLFASTHIQQYQAYFIELDNLCEKINRIPSYEEVVKKLSVARTRTNLSVTLFLDEIKIIIVDKEVQEKYANIDMIHRYLESFEKGTYNYKTIKRYYDKLYKKFEKNKTTLRSIRLALTPAVRFLEYCKNFNQIQPNITMLRGYLWHYPGQKASITGFINFLKIDFKLDISVKNIGKIVFKSPNTSKEQLKQRLISVLRFNEKLKNNNKNLLKISIGYLHGIDIPDNVFITSKDIKINANKDYYIRICGYSFYLPKEITEKLRDETPLLQ